MAICVPPSGSQGKEAREGSAFGLLASLAPRPVGGTKSLTDHRFCTAAADLLRLQGVWEVVEPIPRFAAPGSRPGVTLVVTPAARIRSWTWRSSASGVCPSWSDHLKRAPAGRRSRA